MPNPISPEEYTAASYLRVASLAIAFYDYVQTYPAAWRFYKQQLESRRVALSAVLFFLIRSVSICCLIVSSVGFFYSKFTDATCTTFFLIPPSFKVLQAMVSQAILGIRAYNLSRRSRIIGWGLGCFYIVCCTLQWLSTILDRQPYRDINYRNCRGYNATPDVDLAAWVYYVIAIVYDLSTTFLSIMYLLRYKFSTRSSLMPKLLKMMIYDGLGYFILLTAVNVINLILYRSLNLQTAACALGYTITWIMSQRLLIHLHDASIERRNESINAAVTITQNLESAYSVSHAVRTQFEQKSAGFQLTVPDFESSEGSTELPEHMDVQVRIERTIKLEDQRPRTYELEDYSRSGRSTFSRE
ncbi:hypothetical protein HGRIS_002375 [Hohenbuehelia grisea]|uniref:Gustatory receptor n=1 Tax=Hohenbuehelia grisea TaxID=104357 RepID=A0ABR3JKA9_9AGAR